MQVIKVPTANGIDDIKLIGENELERQFIKQLAEAGTLSCISREVADSVMFRPISVTPELSSYVSTKNSIAKYDFIVRQNEDFIRDLKFEVPVGTPLDLTQYSAIILQVKHSKSAPPIIELALGSGLVISGIGLNFLKVSMTASQTKLLTCESYYYDVLTAKPSSNVYHLEGKITVKNTGTR
ncbi:hypothetical protein ACM55G_14745 [Flavobacterium sp. LB3P122]|uniref:hypothetical protein n=1 Tax=Flavobacterium algoriphilum TaxID=3398738 RepID=UPI003A8B7219